MPPDAPTEPPPTTHSEPQAAPPRDLALTLSGGGFRATLFHLGVIRFLYEHDLLPRVGHVCSVSGGSILAVHLALNWDKYTATKDTEKFKAAADDLIRFIRSDLRGQVVRGWLFSFLAVFPRLWQWCWGQESWQRISLLERGYATWLKDKKTKEERTLADLEKHGEVSTSPPELTILATSMTTGSMCWFEKSGFGWLERKNKQDSENEEDYVVREVKTGRIPLALAVAASSAFPPLFAPVRIDHHRLACSQREFSNTERLTDGGIFENLGIHMLRHLHKLKAVKFKYAVISDAQLQFDWDLEGEYRWLVSRANRSTDILMSRISHLETTSIRQYFDRFGVKLVDCPITDVLSSDEDATAQDEGIQRLTAHVRTDLDRFSDMEIHSLVRHGYAVARLACERAALVKPVAADQKGEPWSPVEYTPQEGDDLNQSAKLRWQIFNGDRYSWLNLGLTLIWLAAMFGTICLATFFAQKGVLTWLQRPIRLVRLTVPDLKIVTAKMAGRMPPTERLAYERLAGVGVDQEYAVIRLQTRPFSEVAGRRRVEELKCRIVYYRKGERAPLAHFAFRVHPDEDGRTLYENLTITRTDKPGVFEITLPPSAPQDSLLILCSVQPEAISVFPPEDLTLLVQLVYP